MPAGDAGLERQPVRLVVDLPRVGHRRGCPDGTESVHHACWPEDSGVVRVRKASRKEMVAVVYRLQAQLAALQAVVDAARRWREPTPDCPAPWSSAMHFEHDCNTARAHCLIGAVDEYDAAQAAQPEGEQAR